MFPFVLQTHSKEELLYIYIYIYILQMCLSLEKQWSGKSGLCLPDRMLDSSQ